MFKKILSTYRSRGVGGLLFRVLRRFLNTPEYAIKQLIGRISGKYFYEDFVRVYPNNIVFFSNSKSGKASQDDINNFLNHAKVYKFAAQFVKDKLVLDAGCGSGYGCEIIANSGAVKVFGCDVSNHAVHFAKNSYGKVAEFSTLGITDMTEYANGYFDITICSEVLEHVKEYKVEKKAIIELKRVTKDGGLIIIATPNSELLFEHGFSYEEIKMLMDNNFNNFVIFENALVPFAKNRRLWENRLANGHVGTIVSENINLSETVLPTDQKPKLKEGLVPGIIKLGKYNIDTSLLHNTHSWTILAINHKHTTMQSN